jgi:hypothetical protein
MIYFITNQQSLDKSPNYELSTVEELFKWLESKKEIEVDTETYLNG